ncbi:MAG TPA: VWA domain-containing protein [Dehalococcoidales bacterium]|nr:VWA domain-containing protein [Dehalococcoidales bacterium]
MRLYIEDLQRAIANSGDVSVFSRLYHRVTEYPQPEKSLSFYGEFPLVKPDILLRDRDVGLANILYGEKTARIHLPASIKLKVLSMPLSGHNLMSYLKSSAERYKPDLIALIVDPLTMAAEIQYAFSLACACDFSCQASIRERGRREPMVKLSFHPAGLINQAILFGWMNKIPVIPLGKRPAEAKLNFVHGQGFIDLNHHETINWEKNQRQAENDLENWLNQKPENAPEIPEVISRDLLRTASESQREKLLEESCYFFSRLMQVLTHENEQSRSPKVLVLSDLAHFPDIKYLGHLLEENITDEIWRNAEPQPDYNNLILDVKNPNYQIVDEAESGSACKLFARYFSDFTESRLNESMTDDEAIKLTAQITGRIRSHPAISGGISVRGTIAMIEVMRGLAVIRGRLNREIVGRSAQIALGSRLRLKSDITDSGLLDDILKETIFGFTFEPDPAQMGLATLKQLSGGNMLDRIGRMGQLPPEGNNFQKTGFNPSIVPSDESDNKALIQLIKMDLIKRGQDGKYRLTRKAVQSLLDELEFEMKSGDISADEYHSRKTALQNMLKSMVQPRFKMSSKELAETIMELVDAHDSQWNKEINFQSLRTYYHIKENSEGSKLSEYKRDYHSLQKLIEDLEKRNILAPIGPSSGLILTGLAMDFLLKAILIDTPVHRDAHSSLEKGQAVSYIRSIETRRYSSGDTFRDIAIRPTLREIARQKRSLKNIRRSDLRVFLKQRRKTQKDIMLCIDTSGSMGFHQKLLYARLAAAGICKAGLREKNRVGLIAFSDSDQITVPLTEENDTRFLDIVAGLQARGNTNIGEGIKRSRQMLFENRSRNQKHLVLISDGQPTAISEEAYSKLQGSPLKDLTEEYAIAETRLAARQGIRLSIIHIAGDGESNEQFVKDLVRCGGGILKRIKGPGDLKNLVN